MKASKICCMLLACTFFSIAVNAQTGNSRNAQARAYYSAGAKSMNMKDYADAIGAFSKAIELDPNYGRAYWARGISYVLSHQNKWAAIRDLDKAEQYLQNAALYFHRGRAKMYDDKREAIADLTEAIRRLPSPEYFYYRAQTYIFLDQHDSAAQDLTYTIDEYKRAETDPKLRAKHQSKFFLPTSLYQESYVLRATAYKALGKFDLAVADYSAALRIDPAYAGYYYSERAQVYEKMAKYDLAAADYTRLIATSPKTGGYYARRASAHCKAGKKKAAAADEAKARELKAPVLSRCK